VSHEEGPEVNLDSERERETKIWLDSSYGIARQ
jgi:hypothetical protein